MTRARRPDAVSLTLDALLEQSGWYTALDAATRLEVRAHMSERAVASGDSLGHAGECQLAWFGVLEGLIKWAIGTPDGRTITLGGQAMGSWFGEGTLIRNLPRQSDLVALRHSRVALMPRDTFDWLRQHRPQFNDFLLRQVNERLHWFMGSVAAHGLKDTDTLVARALVGMVHPQLNPRGERHLSLSQEELAHLAAVSRQSCNAVIARFKAAGLVQAGYGGVVVLDLPGLQHLAG